MSDTFNVMCSKCKHPTSFDVRKLTCGICGGNSYVPKDNSIKFILERNIDNKGFQHALDAMRYAFESTRFTRFHGGRQQGKTFTSLLINEYEEQLRRQVMNGVNCDHCGASNVVNNDYIIKAWVECGNCGKRITYKRGDKTRSEFAPGAAIPRIPRESMLLHSMPPKLTPSFFSGILSETNDDVYTFNISAVELLDICELAGDLSRENPALIVKIKGDLSHTKILVHDSITIKADILEIAPPFSFHRMRSGFVIFDIADGVSTYTNEKQANSEIISSVCKWVRKVKSHSIKKLTTSITVTSKDKDGKEVNKAIPVQVQVVKVVL